MSPQTLAPATLETAIRLAGFGQLLLFAVSPVFPKVLGWREEMAKSVRPLTRQVFWTWAAYVWYTHLCFGLLSAFGASLLASGTPLARCVSSFIAVWWSARLVVQFAYFDRTAAPPGLVYKVGEAALVTLFLTLTVIYATAALAIVSGRPSA